ncbi:MAG TPA: endolytic transglycosylase MltG [Candidatus Sulfotelmatobacter sp.]
MRKLFWLILVALLAAAGWFAWAVLTPTQPTGQVFVLLHPGYSTRRIAVELKSAGVIRNEDAFILWHYVHRHRSLKAGEYLFEKPASIIDLQKRLRRGDVYLHTVVVPEGFTMFDIARAIEAAGLGPADDFLKVAQSDTALIADIAPNAPSLEGYLFPDTYEFTRLMSMQEMAAAMVCQFRKVAHQIELIDSATGESAECGCHSSPANGQRSGCIFIQVSDKAVRDRSATLTALERTVIMASIIEKETSVPEERPLVASVYFNRLEKNIALDADPSIIYAELLAGSYTGALHHADMQFHSPYNTYRNAGLPPGAIGNPGKSALEAAMHPAQSDYYYFVADAQGHHRFAHSMEEHNKNVAAYRKAVRGR